MEDEYLITLAIMHGCEFYCFHSCYWYPAEGGAVHEVERANYEENKVHYFTSPKALAEAYCKFYNLGTHGGNNEKTSTSHSTVDHCAS